MNKKILPFAVAGILAGAMGAAQAGGVTLYGKVLVSFDALDCDVGMFTGGGCNRGGTATTNGDDFLMNSRPGFGAVGVKGSEDLGNGLTAMFQLEYGTDPSEAAGFTGRDQWLGMKGGFGALRFGAMSTNYKMSGAKLDPMWRTSLDSRDAVRLSGLHAGAGENGQGRATNTVRYDSPSFSGAKVVANYTLDSGADGNDGYGIGLHYSAGAIFASVDYITNDNGGDDDAWKLGGKYTMGDAAFYGHYERGALLFQSSNQLDAGAAGDDGADMPMTNMSAGPWPSSTASPSAPPPTAVSNAWIVTRMASVTCSPSVWCTTSDPSPDGQEVKTGPAGPVFFVSSTLTPWTVVP
jgi:predicted porin